MKKDDIAFISTDIVTRTTTPYARMYRLSEHNKEWDINDFELLSGWNYCKSDK